MIDKFRDLKVRGYKIKSISVSSNGKVEVEFVKKKKKEKLKNGR